jgi:hypothetical protein
MSAKKQKLEGWADDLKLGVKNKIEEVRRAATTALTLEEKLASQKHIKTLESQRNEKRRSPLDAQQGGPSAGGADCKNRRKAYAEEWAPAAFYDSLES